PGIKESRRYDADGRMTLAPRHPAVGIISPRLLYPRGVRSRREHVQTIDSARRRVRQRVAPTREIRHLSELAVRRTVGVGEAVGRCGDAADGHPAPPCVTVIPIA